MIFDTHAHYDDDAFDEDRDTLLGEIFSSGICCITDVGASVKSSKSAVALSKKWPQIYAAVGVHPDSTADMTEEDIETLRSLAQEKKVVAIGEIGLDYYWDNSPREVQKKWFERQLELGINDGYTRHFPPTRLANRRVNPRRFRHHLWRCCQACRFAACCAPGRRRA